MNKQKKIIVTGAAGLVGQNLLLLLGEEGYTNVVALDKHRGNLSIVQKLNPSVVAHCVDLSMPGDWEKNFSDAAVVIQLHAQITGVGDSDFQRNNVESTDLVVQACERYRVPFLIHVSSSVINSVADDAYTRTKAAQEELVRNSSIAHCVLRPTLMFGWFDPKHFGWLSRFMAKTPIFPIPGNGKFLRQPLYNRDFCRVILVCIDKLPENAVFDVVGAEDISYIDLVKMIKQTKRSHTLILPIPFAVFEALLRLYARLIQPWTRSKEPPFTVSQLRALAAGDYFTGVDMEKEFGVTPTPLVDAVKETFTDPRYSDIVVER